MSRRWLAPLLAAAFALGGCGRDYEVLPPGEERVTGEEAGIAARMIDAIRDISLQRHPQGRVLRFNQVKTLGCVDGEFEVLPDVPPELAQGLFAAGARYPARLRFANATQFDDTEKDFRGLSITLSDVPGPTLWGQPGRQDFLLNSHPGLFAATPADFLSFIEATRDGKRWRYFLNPAHWYSLVPILRGRDTIEDPFNIRYWSTTPYLLGEGRAVKYSTRACPGTAVTATVEKGEDFLTRAMSAHLEKSPVCLEFMVQPQTDPATMPVENAAVIWDEEASPFVPLARITITENTIADNARACETMHFNPWQSLPAHRPLGGINRVRKAVYAELSEFRNAENVRRGVL